MKRLYLLRHAKSSWDDPSLADFDRTLNGRGRRAAEFMGRYVAEQGYVPDAIVSSPARRARETAELVKANAGLTFDIRFDERIYEASPNTLRQVASEIDDALASAMLVGHNPGMEGFVRYLTGTIESMPTAALAVIDLDTASWANIDHLTGRLVRLIRPKEVM